MVFGWCLRWGCAIALAPPPQRHVRAQLAVRGKHTLVMSEVHSRASRSTRVAASRTAPCNTPTRRSRSATRPSASFGVGGFKWSADAKPDFEKALTKLRTTYNSKYEEWMQDLETSLQTLDQSKEENLGTRDWYPRFGYIYYSFMADRYQSPD